MPTKKRKPKFEKLSVNLHRRGELRYETAYYAKDAAKLATKWAKKGWEADVQSWQSLGTKRVHMSCRPATVREKTVARCTMTPAFKKRILRR